MPLCPQITNTPITVTQTADFTVTSVIPAVADTKDGIANEFVAVDTAIGTAQTTANNAATAAGAAQSTANTALANAATAYTTAINSLQPSAYAIQNPTTKQLTAIDATGLTVYSGASSTSGARVVMNSLGLAGYNASNNATFSISATTGAAVFSGSVTGSTITGGSLNIAGNCIIDSSGLLTATGATITGTINATAGYFGTVSNGFSIGSVGLTGVGSGAITGGTIQTSSGSNAVIMSGANNALQFKVSGSVSGNIIPLGSAGIIMHYGSTPDGTGGTYPKTQVTSSSATIAGSTSQSFSAGAGGNTITGQTTVTDTMTFSADIFPNGNVDGGVNCEFYAYRGATNTTTGNAANAWLNATTGRLARSTSSLRYKLDVQPQSIPFESILALEPKSFYDKREYDENPESAKRILGLIAEEVAQIPVLKDLLVNYDGEGRPDAISYPTIAVAMLPLLKDLYQRIQTLEQGN